LWSTAPSRNPDHAGSNAWYGRRRRPVNDYPVFG
jgi:hypothetical protein